MYCTLSASIGCTSSQGSCEIPTSCCWGECEEFLRLHTQTHAGTQVHVHVPSTSKPIISICFSFFLEQQVKIKVCLWSDRARKNQNNCTGNILHLSIRLAVSAAQDSQMRVNIGQPEKDMCFK